MTDASAPVFPALSDGIEHRQPNARAAFAGEVPPTILSISDRRFGMERAVLPVKPWQMTFVSCRSERHDFCFRTSYWIGNR